VTAGGRVRSTANGEGPPTAPAVEVNGLRFRYPDGHEALAGMDLTVASGQRVALLGPNGAGKTTLALHLNGINLPDAGTVRIGGLLVAEPDLTEVRRRVGLVFQDADDQLFMPSVAEDVAFGPANLGLRGTELDARVDEALAAVGAADLRTRAPHHLSGGERRRVALATVLAMRPDVLVLDEPTSGLDPAGRRELVDVLCRLHITQLVITHDLPFALELCPRSVIIDRGRVVADGPTLDLLADDDLLRRHRLELPFGLDPRVVAPRR
jgi:cobalt/nickel transport system ATP-binding protein